MDKGSVTQIDFYSEALSQSFELLIYVPANYSPLSEYNVCIASDGRDYFQLGAIPRLADELIDAYEIEQTIFVGIPYENAKDRKRKYIPSGEQFAAYMQFIGEELFPYLQQQYTITPQREGRALIGDSMAATAGLMAALHYPDLFGKVALQSPYVDELVLQALDSASSLPAFIYHVIGLGEVEVLTTDGSIQDFLTPNRTLHAHIVEKGIPTFYDEFNGDHKWTHWKPDLRRALTEIFE